MVKRGAVPSDIILYNKVKKIAKDKFERYPSIYASAWIVRRYKKSGGTYKGPRDRQMGLSKWFKEKWVQVGPFLRSGRKIPCGSKTDSSTKACRPTVRVSPSTPATLAELIRLHGKRTVLKIATQKNRDMRGKVYWKRGKYYPP